jgi:hypothetical protein
MENHHPPSSKKEEIDISSSFEEVDEKYNDIDKVFNCEKLS